MEPILVVYGTREGHTRKIAEHVAATLEARRLTTELIDAKNVPRGLSLKNYAAAVVCASVHLAKHESEIIRFVKQNLADLKEIPTAFFTVSLAEAGAENKRSAPQQRAEAQANVKRTIDAFLAETGWNPPHIKAVAGALMYLKYNFAVRFVMKRIAREVGEPTDTSRNYEFTDWAGLDQAVNELAQSILLEMPSVG